MIPREEIVRIARLAKLSISPSEEDRLSGQLLRILEYVELLRAIDEDPSAGEDGPVAGPFERDDQPGASLDRDVVLALAPATDGQTFLVPPVLDAGGAE